MGSRAAFPRKERYISDCRGRVVRFIFVVTLFNDPLRKIGLTGVFLFASTTARSSNALLGWNCGYVMFSNVGGQAMYKPADFKADCPTQIMYGVLYAISPEIFPAKDRGTGNGLTATATRVFGVMVCASAFWSCCR